MTRSRASASANASPSAPNVPVVMHVFFDLDRCCCPTGVPRGQSSATTNPLCTPLPHPAPVPHLQVDPPGSFFLFCHLILTSSESRNAASVRCRLRLTGRRCWQANASSQHAVVSTITTPNAPLRSRPPRLPRRGRRPPLLITGATRRVKAIRRRFSCARLVRPLRNVVQQSGDACIAVQKRQWCATVIAGT